MQAVKLCLACLSVTWCPHASTAHSLSPTSLCIDKHVLVCAQVFDVHTSKLLNELQMGHAESINAAVWNPLLGELYTGANDSQILVWAPGPRKKLATTKHASFRDDTSEPSTSDSGSDDDDFPSDSPSVHGSRTTHAQTSQRTVVNRNTMTSSRSSKR